MTQDLSRPAAIAPYASGLGIAGQAVLVVDHFRLCFLLR